MPKPIYNYSASAILKLKEEIRLKSGIKFNSIDDCQRLALSIGELQKTYISEHTIARFFKVILSKTTPSLYTLDILSEYCGYSSWNYFYNLNSEQFKETSFTFQKNTSLHLLGDSEILLIKYCLEEHSFAPILKYLHKVVPQIIDLVNEDCWKLVYALGNSIKTDSLVRKKLIPEIVKDEYLRKFFFNLWVDSDGLSIYYAEILKNQFLKHLNPQDINYKKDYCWANSMLMLNYIRTGQLKEFLKIAYSIYNHNHTEEFKCHEITDVYPFARFHACHIIYQFFSQPKTPQIWYEKKLEFIKNEINSFRGSYSFFFNSFEDIEIVIYAQILEALHIAEKTETIFVLQDNIIKILDLLIYNKKGVISGNNNILKILYYLHLIAKSDANEFKIISPYVYKFPDGCNLSLTADTQNENTYMNLIIKSLYVENSVNKEELIANAKSLALNLKNRMFLRQIELLNQDL